MKITLIKVTGFFLILIFAFTLRAQENCTKDKINAVCDDKIVKDKVDWACNLLAEKGKNAVSEIKKMRFDCCGEPDYVWINDFQFKMIMHPIKPQLDNTFLSEKKDPDGKLLFVEFVKAAKANPKGSWVDYKWTKVGEKDPSPKRSWVRACQSKGEKEAWVVGSGSWKK